MPKYLFTHDERDNSFPDRYRVVGADEDAEFLRVNENLTGTVPDTQAIDLLEQLMARCEVEQSLRVELVDAPYWRFIELRFKPAEADAAMASEDPPRGGGFVT